MQATIWRLLARLHDREQRILIGADEVVIGASAECDATIADPTVSRRHARLFAQDGQLVVEDLGSSNGTWVDGRRVEGRAVVRAGGQLRLGDVELHVDEVSIDESITAIGADAQVAAPSGGDPAQVPETMVASGVVRFCLRELEPLLVRASMETDVAKLAALVANALVRSHRGIGVGILRGSDAAALVGSAGRLAGPSASFAFGDYSLRIHGIETRDEPGLASLARMLLAVLNRTERPAGPAPAAEDGAARAQPHVDVSLLTSSPALRDIYAQATRIAPSRLNVLITGESGAGKELLARHLHEASGEADDRFLVLNCAALPSDLLDAELFGIEAGVATGVRERAGRFELADGGTVFLDEIGDMSLDTQARILRVLQEKEVYRVGSHRPRPADVRIIAATHRDLQDMVRDGRFRLDLYHRICDWRAMLPALRDRREDIPGLAAQFLTRACHARGVRSGGLSKAVVDALCAYRWPGNVRELEREMSRVALFVNDGEVVGSDLLRTEIRLAEPAEVAGSSLEARLANEERRIIAEALERCRNKVEAAARELGVSKSTLYRRVERLGLEVSPDR